jgi:hypothetical protein
VGPPSPGSCQTRGLETRPSGRTHRPCRPTPDNPGRAPQRHRGTPADAAAHHRPPRARWEHSREPRHTMCQGDRQRPSGRGGVLLTVCGPGAASCGLADLGAHHGGPWCGPRWPGPADPRGLYRSRPAAGVARAARPHRARSRRPPARPRRAGQRTETGGRAGGMPRRGRLCWDPPAPHGSRRRLVIGVPDGLPQDGVVGRRALASRPLGGVAHARAPHRVIGGVVDTCR